jgi:hypothetical protein
MRRTPLALPLLRNAHERTGGLNRFSRQGNTSTLSVDRLRPVHGSDMPGLGNRMNSGRIGLCVTADGSVMIFMLGCAGAERL